MVRKGGQVVGVQVEERIVQNRGASSDRASSSVSEYCWHRILYTHAHTHTHTYTYTRTLVGVLVWGCSYVRKCDLLWCKVEAGGVNALVYWDQRYM